MSTNTDVRVTMRRPATRWQEALPVGNGRHGALLFGNRQQDTLIINHESLWLPVLDPRRERRPLRQLLPRVRELILAGQPEAADALWQQAAKEAGYSFVYSDPCHPAGQLRVTAETGGDFTGYRREIDLSRGVATVRWREGDRECSRAAFVSRADDVVVVRGSGRSTLELLPVETRGVQVWAGTEYPVDELVTIETTAGDGWQELRGRYRHGGGFRVVARIEATDDGWLVLIKCGDGARAALAALPADFAALLARHEPLHRELFERVQFNLGEEDGRSVEELLLASDDGAVPMALVEQTWALGRYLFISATHERSQYPPHLQGLWTGTWRPPWFGNYTLDENVQMCHWQALPGQLPELTAPLHRYIGRSLPDWRWNADQLFGCRGLLAPLLQSTNGRNDAAEWQFWISGAGWLAQHFWEYWLFTGDETFLRHEVLPLLTGVAEFYADYLVGGADGRLWFVPSVSVENKPVGWPSRSAINATMDVAVAREVLGHLGAARDRLGVDAVETARWRDLRARLPEYAVNAAGALAEWIHPRLPDNYHHRHQSHLYPLFPGSEITRQGTPALFAAARRAVDERRVTGLTSQTAWSLAHMAHIYARLEAAEDARQCLEFLLRGTMQDNLLSCANDWRGMGLTMNRGVKSEEAFQIDANLGFTSAVQEMLCQSTPDGLTLLPALPVRWRRGHIRGLATRCRVTVDITWEQDTGKVTCDLRSGSTSSVRVRLAATEREVPLPARLTLEFPKGE